jgi:Transcriptional regulator
MVPTEFGRLVLPKIQAWLDDSQAMIDEFREWACTTSGKVTLATLPALSSPLMGQLFSAVKKRFPGIRMSILEGYAEQIERWLENGHADLGIVLRYDQRLRDADVNLANVDVYLCSTGNDPLTSEPELPFDMLDQLPLVIHNVGGALHRYLELLFRERGMTLNIVVEANSLSIQRDIVISSGAYALLSRNAVAQDIDRGRIRASRIVGPSVIQHLDLGYARHGAISKATREVGRLLLSLVRSSPEYGSSAESS